VLPGETFDQSDLGFGDLIGINASYSDSLLVYVEHDLNRFCMFLMENILQHLHNELLGSIIVIVQ
jgi:hypothetical protein